MKQKNARHPIGVVTRKTGLRSELIRAWERRHRAVEPYRTSGNHRLYSDEEIERLLQIRDALGAGWQIGQVAALPTEEIRQLVGSPDHDGADDSAAPETRERLEHHLARSMESIAALDGERLECELEAASVALSRVELMDRLLVQLMDDVSQACSEGKLRIAHEHLTSAVLRAFLDSMRAAFPASESSPGIVVTTPVFQHHELAAMLVAATARSEGWRTTYLGPNLPAEEIVGAVRQRNARALALSLTYPPGVPEVESDLLKIGRLLPPGVDLVVGGRSVDSYGATLDEVGAIRIANLTGLRAYLSHARLPRVAHREGEPS